MKLKTQEELVEINSVVTDKLIAQSHYLSNFESMRGSDVYIFHNDHHFLYFTYQDQALRLARVFNEDTWKQAMLSQDNPYIPLDTYLEPFQNIPFDVSKACQRFAMAKALVQQLWESPFMVLTLELYEGYPFDYIRIPFNGYHRIGSGGDVSRILDYIMTYENDQLRYYDWEHMVRDVFAHRGPLDKMKLHPPSPEHEQIISFKKALLERIRKVRYGNDLLPDQLLSKQTESHWFALWIDKQENLFHFEIDSHSGAVMVEKYPSPYALEILEKKRIDLQEPSKEYLEHHVFGRMKNRDFYADPPFLNEFTESRHKDFWLNIIQPRTVLRATEEGRVKLTFGGGKPDTYSINEKGELWHRYGHKPAPFELWYTYALKSDWFFKLEIGEKP